MSRVEGEGKEKKYRAKIFLKMPRTKSTTVWAANAKEAEKRTLEEFWAWFKSEFPVVVEVSEL